MKRPDRLPMWIVRNGETRSEGGVRCECCGQRQAFDVLGWLDAKGIRLKPGPAYALRYLFEHADEITSVEEWCEDVRVNGSTLRWQTRKKGLPAPIAWVSAARGLVIAADLRAEPRSSVAVIAWMAGFGDHSAVAHHLRRTFGTTASTIRTGSVTDLDLMEHWYTSTREPRRIAA